MGARVTLYTVYNQKIKNKVKMLGTRVSSSCKQNVWKLAYRFFDVNLFCVHFREHLQKKMKNCFTMQKISFLFIFYIPSITKFYPIYTNFYYFIPDNDFTNQYAKTFQWLLHLSQKWLKIILNEFYVLINKRARGRYNFLIH